MTINEFAKSRKSLFWSTHNYTGLSSEAVVEAVLNYGNWDDVKQIIAILGMKQVAKIFNKQTSPNKVRNNYRPRIKNYFQLYFNRYA